MTSNPTLVKDFVAASLKGYQDAIADPSAAVASMLSQVQAVGEDQATAVTQLKFTVSVAYSKANTQQCLGYNVAADWNNLLGYLEKYASLNSTVTDASAFYTNQFVTCP